MGESQHTLEAPRRRSGNDAAPRSAGRSERFVRETLATADVNVGGDRPWDIRVNDPRFFSHILTRGSLGAGESYMDGWWDCEQLDEAVHRVVSARLGSKLLNRNRLSLLFAVAQAKLLNPQSKRRSRRVGEQHYDLGNEFFEAMLDKRMIYSCGYWAEADDLDAAQEAKLDLICRKLGLQRGMEILDIGCGWGGLLQYAAENYGVRGLGITISEEQAEFARQRVAGLPIEIRLQDYRELNGRFDRVVSVGMLEHVGHRNYPRFMQQAARCLRDGGQMLLQFIASNQRHDATNPWVERYIFPGGYLPTLAEVLTPGERYFVAEDVHAFGPDYDRTLMAWDKRFRASWPRFRDRYGDRFYRMWRFYLLSFAGTFRARDLQLFQLVLAKRPRSTYRSVR